MGSKPSGGGSGGGSGNKKDKKIYGMGPGQSMAMAGNTGLASFTEKDINKVQQAKKDYNKFTGNNNQNTSFTNIGQEIGELGSKYRRPVKIADGLGPYSDGSGRRYNPNDFDSQGNFRTFTASKPTFAQVMGDVGRAFKGYNSINYDQPGVSNSPVSMVDTPGLIEQGIFSPSLTIGKALLNAIPSFKNQTQETLPSYYGREGYIPSYQRSDPSSDEEEDDNLINNILAKYSGMTNQGFTPEGFDFPMQEPIVETPYIPSGKSAGAPQDTGAPIFDVSKILQEKFYEDKIARDDRRSKNENNNGGGGGGSEGGGEEADPSNFTENQLMLIANLMAAGYSREEAESRAKGYGGFAYGGSVAPQSGPMSEGVGTLYRMK